MGIFGRHNAKDGVVNVTVVASDDHANLPPLPQMAGRSERLESYVSADWMAFPTLTEAGGQIPLAGTSYYQDAIDHYGGPRRVDGPTNNLVMAQLIDVTDGSYAGSIAVFVGGDRVGTLRHGLAEDYRPVLASLGCRAAPAMCRAAIYGGHYGYDPAGWRNYGVGLYQPSHPTPAPGGAPFLPPCIGIGVVLLDGVADSLDAGLNSRAKNKIRRAVGCLDPSGWTVTLDGGVIGSLETTLGGLGRFRMVQAAADAGWPLTCFVRVIRELDKPLRVMADIPIPSIVWPRPETLLDEEPDPGPEVRDEVRNADCSDVVIVPT